MMPVTCGFSLFRTLGLERNGDHVRICWSVKNAPCWLRSALPSGGVLATALHTHSFAIQWSADRANNLVLQGVPAQIATDPVALQGAITAAAKP